MNRPTPLLAAILVLLAAVPAQAGFRSGIKTISAVAVAPAPETIHVYNDGNKYTHVTQTHVWFRAQTSVECKYHNDLMYSVLAVGKVSTASGKLGPQQGPWAEVATNGSQSAFKANVGELFAPPRKNPPQLCNQELDRRVANGEPRIQLLQHGFDLLLHHDLTFLANCKYTGLGIGAEYDSTGAGPDGPGWPQGTPWDGWGHANTGTYSSIRCEGRTDGSFASTPKPPKPPRPASDDLAVPFQVTRATLAVSPKTATTECPATLTANGSITVVGSGTVQYRVEHNGGLGPVQELHFPAHGRKSKALSFQLEVGHPSGGELGEVSAPGGGGAGAGIGGFSNGQQPKDKAAGSLRLIIVSPEAGVDHSNPTGYSVTCKTPPPKGPGSKLNRGTNPKNGHGGD